MSDAKSKITDAELELMKVLWAAKTPITQNQLTSTLSQTHDWNVNTIKTLLRRLCQKKAVAQEKREVFYYYPLVGQEALNQYQTQKLIDKLYAGSAKTMVAALVEHNQLKRDDVEDLQKMFAGLWQKEEN